MELEQQWDQSTQKGLMGKWAVVGGSLHPSLGAQWMGTVAQRPWRSEIPCWVLRLGLTLISTCPAGGSVREGGGETWG